MSDRVEGDICGLDTGDVKTSMLGHVQKAICGACRRSVSTTPAIVSNILVVRDVSFGTDVLGSP